MASEQAIADEVIRGLKTNRRPWKQKFEAKIPLDVGGLYAFWLARQCLYVGMSTQLATRIYHHRVQEHNPELADFLERFWDQVDASYVLLPELDTERILCIERAAIRRLRAKANKI